MINCRYTFKHGGNPQIVRKNVKFVSNFPTVHYLNLEHYIIILLVLEY
jgi:hypothetical protein